MSIHRQHKINIPPENSGTDKPWDLGYWVVQEWGAVLENLGDSDSLGEAAVVDLKETFDCC